MNPSSEVGGEKQRGKPIDEIEEIYFIRVLKKEIASELHIGKLYLGT